MKIMTFLLFAISWQSFTLGQAHLFELSEKKLFRELNQIWSESLKPEESIGSRVVFNCISIKRKRSATAKGWGPRYWKKIDLTIDEVNEDISFLAKSSWKVALKYPQSNEDDIIIKAYKNPSHKWARGRQYYTKYYLCW